MCGEAELRVCSSGGPAGGGDLRRFVLISVELFFVALATTIAVVLRGYFDTVSESLIALMPYSFVSLGCASVVFFAGGLDRIPWRYSTVADHLQVIVLTMLAILLALVVTFALNRLAPVARSLPVLQGGLIISILIGARSAARFWHTRSLHTNGNGRIIEQPHETVLVVGVNTVTELFLMSVKEFASERTQVAGILAEDPNMRCRAIHQKPVLGTVEELHDILQSLQVHGTTVDRIVVATAADQLRPRSLKTLLEVESSSAIFVEFLSERLGFEGVPQRSSGISSQERRTREQRAVARVGGAIDADHANFAGKFFRFEKRIVDVLGAALLIFALSPVTILIAFIVAFRCRISCDILAAATRPLWKAVQAVQISDNACVA